MVTAAARAGDGAQPHRLHRAPDELRARTGCPTEQHAAYYAARAAGGAGLIITEEHSTHPTDWPYEKLIHGFHREVIPGYRRITDAVHRHRTPIFAQINHNGGQASLDVHAGCRCGRRRRSPTRCSARCPRRSTSAEIAEIVAGYALVAEHCAEGGFDGIELQCSHSLDRARLPVAGHQPAHRRLRRLAGEPGPAAARARGRGARRDRPRPGARRAAVRRRADRGRHHDRRRGRGRPHGRGAPGTSTTSTPRSAWRPPDAVHDRGVDARPARLRDVHPVGDPQGGRAARSSASAGSRIRCRPSGRSTEGQCDLVGVVRGQIADADFAAKAALGSHRRDPAVPVVQPGVRRAHGAQPLARLHREPADRPRGDTGVGRGPTRRTRRDRCWSSAPGRPGCRRRIAAARNGHHVTVYERDGQAGGQVRLAATSRTAPSSAISSATS